MTFSYPTLLPTPPPPWKKLKFMVYFLCFGFFFIKALCRKFKQYIKVQVKGKPCQVLTFSR